MQASKRSIIKVTLCSDIHIEMLTRICKHTSSAFMPWLTYYFEAAFVLYHSFKKQTEGVI